MEGISFKNPEKQVVLFHVDPVGYKNTAAVHDAEHIVFAGLFSQKLSNLAFSTDIKKANSKG